MAKIPVISRLVVEDFPDQQKWIGKLLNPINTFMAALAFAATKHLTFTDNFLGQDQFLDFTYNGTQTLPISFLVSLSATPLSLEVVSALENLSNPVAVVMAWKLVTSTQIQITDISKISLGVCSTLVVGARYQIRVRIAP